MRPVLGNVTLMTSALQLRGLTRGRPLRQGQVAKEAQYPWCPHALSLLAMVMQLHREPAARGVDSCSAEWGDQAGYDVGPMQEGCNVPWVDCLV